MRKGGYQIIDLQKKAVTAGAASGHPIVPGVYDKIEGTEKRTVVSGLVIGSTEYKDMDVTFLVSSTDLVATLPDGYTLTITDDDEIKATAPVVPDPDEN